MSLCDQLYRPPFEGAESGNRPHYQQDRSAKLFRLSGSQALRRRVQVCRARSEEHTSELQSLMRISYAVFCLKKKKTKTEHTITKEHHKKHPKTIYTNQ